MPWQMWLGLGVVFRVTSSLAVAAAMEGACRGAQETWLEADPSFALPPVHASSIPTAMLYF
jgi:hypothetical protein